jgi:soluble lytic murein transglycosylase-like protein
LAAAAIAALAGFSCDAANAGESVCEREMHEASKLYDVPLGVLYAVGMTETGDKGSLQPFALNVEGRTMTARSAKEAVKIFEQSKRKGAVLIDLGCMQINHRYHGGQFASVADMLSPQQNVAYAAKFLNTLREREGSWTMAVARYHAGPDNDPAQKRYVCKVIVNLVAAGFGSWTEGARSFCGKPAQRKLERVGSRE